MDFPERFSDLPEYAFPRLRTLLDSHQPGDEPIVMTIGEPRHAFPDWVGNVLAENVDGFAKYPANDGSPALQQAIADWIKRRYDVSVDAGTQVLPLNGTREGLFNALIALSPETKGGKQPVILTPNPFYQVYAVAALAVGAEPVYVPATDTTGNLPDYAGLPPEILERVTVAYICSPANPQGAVADRAYWADLISLAEQYDFQIFADECYSEIYREMPPPGALQIASEIGADPDRVVIFHSLSKRSNLPGLRSGFAAGGEKSIARLKQLRAYAGAPLPMPLQAVAARAWADEDHVITNRALYAEKYAIADEVFDGLQGYRPPEAGFFLWLPAEDGEAATLKLWRETGVRVLPGAYLARTIEGHTPGADRIRVAMVAEKDDMRRGLIKLRDCLYR
ncbi:aminotransferase class I/II-fold pyridoxal phosphate-dependent enzyme [Roseobacter sp. HKCCD9010]|uniref:aminotransferase class I/II-fold pyridoxal phosphate-dependent enzyme n=1 Tax=unclassified Roseobacter TaxID=196798 RepID=UPI001491217E|nr:MULTISPECIES: aminotransferase class I/II-fold pyridoxal phosphate-dependent enzyme [unclassified Roseobacter]MBF9048590.1 aminotransferase class I/II-fold pyridoxal phosphate-dependent enzyme [Rhodobacterales bacterium HKCCD4356]NNV10589.1 aminotransferase class I/II-fold pyridoxal phosphate-dependent enzyme [Roseobacter sp. HKCCD7357]NNV14774.1 aminotransferase class I/II-fold pyridoxal phosphate-dependent enzyme [Roseobacter sp. HKCCD8768]NNV24233.1 aminotransferase class I/II-fold pyrido